MKRINVNHYVRQQRLHRARVRRQAFLDVIKFIAMIVAVGLCIIALVLAT